MLTHTAHDWVLLHWHTWLLHSWLLHAWLLHAWLLVHLLLRWHHLYHFKHVHVVHVVDLIEYDIGFHLNDTLTIKEVLHLVVIKTHLSALLHESLLLVDVVLGDWEHQAGRVWSHRHLLSNLLPLSLSLCVWHNLHLSHVVEQLGWNLHQSLLGEEMWIVLEIIEGHELYNVRSHILPV